MFGDWVQELEQDECNFGKLYVGEEDWWYIGICYDLVCYYQVEVLDEIDSSEQDEIVKVYCFVLLGFEDKFIMYFWVIGFLGF